MTVLLLLDEADHEALAPPLQEHGITLVRDADQGPEAVVAVLGSTRDEEARRIATEGHIPVVWIADAREVARRDSRLAADAHFVVRPVQPAELVARLRRAAQADALTMLSFPDREVNLDRAEVVVGDEVRSLTATEVRLMRVLASAQGRLLTRAELLRKVWGYRGGTRTRALDMAVRRLRTKLEPAPSSPTYLLTGVGVGYRLELEGVRVEHGSGELASVRQEDLPVSDTPFCGRESELFVLERLLARPGARVSLVGPPGVGKKRLVMESLAQGETLAWRLVVPEGAKNLDAELCRAAGLEPQGTAADALQTLAQTPGHRGERVVPLAPLDPEAGCRLLRALWEQHATLAEPLSLDDPELLRLHELAGGLPLVHELLGAGFATRSPAELLRDWSSLLELRGDPLRDLLTPLWRDLSPELRRGLAGLCQLTGSCSPTGVEYILGELLGRSAPTVLTGLIERALVQRRRSPSGTRLWVPDPLMRFVRAVDDAELQRQARAAVFGWCCRLGDRGVLEGLHRPGAAGLFDEIFARETDVQRAVASGTLDASDMLHALTTMFYQGVYGGGAGSLVSILESLDPSLRFEPIEQAQLDRMRIDLVMSRTARTPPLDALDAAVLAARKAGEPNLEAIFLKTAGYVALANNNPALATERVERSLAVVEGVKPWIRANVLGFAVAPRLKVADRQAVEDEFLQVFAERCAAGDALAVSRGAGWVAHPHWRAGRLGAALDALEAGVRAARALSDRAGEIQLLGNIATLRLVLDDVPGALEAQERALAGMRRQGMRQGLVVDLSVYAELLHVVGDDERCMQHLREARGACRLEPLPRYRWVCFRSAGRLHLARGEWGPRGLQAGSAHLRRAGQHHGLGASLSGLPRCLVPGAADRRRAPGRCRSGGAVHLGHQRPATHLGPARSDRAARGQHGSMARTLRRGPRPSRGA